MTKTDGRWPLLDATQQFRAEKLADAGYNDLQAETLAVNGCDLHRACDVARAVLAKGMPIELAFDVMA